jgi:hypothetical protein
MIYREKLAPYEKITFRGNDEGSDAFVIIQLLPDQGLSQSKVALRFSSLR